MIVIARIPYTAFRVYLCTVQSAVPCTTRLGHGRNAGKSVVSRRTEPLYYVGVSSLSTEFWSAKLSAADLFSATSCSEF